jgi:hypothetical protein
MYLSAYINKRIKTQIINWNLLISLRIINDGSIKTIEITSRRYKLINKNIIYSKVNVCLSIYFEKGCIIRYIYIFCVINLIL